MKGVLDSEIHRLTGGVHVVGLASDRGVLCVREDIGRHNAMDRAIGYGLTEGIDLARTFVVSSGRISSEMARKCLVAGIPIVVSRSATTVLAVELAEKNGLTICAFARGSRMNVYTHTHRIRITGGGPA
ncbi:MAG: formate dehydrogenase family accessory protein FdhD [Methanomicrobia archaeon]|nr:formate dehydrogenase family accessory protein FdhD [Methanomicrobia archaeon]